MNKNLLFAIPLAVATVALSSSKSQAEEIRWMGNLESAWQVASERNQPLLIFVTSPHCGYCTKMSRETFRDPAIVERIGGSFVALKLTGQQAARQLPGVSVEVVPTTLIVSREAKIVDRIEGFVPAHKLKRRLRVDDPR